MVFGLIRRVLGGTPGADTPASSPGMPSPDGGNALPVPRAPPAAGPLLWQDVAYGMSVEDVRATRPDAVLSKDAQRLHDGASSMLKIPSLRLADHDYSVLFYFRGGGLTQVTIATNGGPSVADFEGITNALRLRYGREVAFKDSPDSFSTGEWLSGDGTNVSLVFHEEIGCLNVNFQYRYADAAAQL